LKSGFKIKFGLYYNREFFSDFYIPLAGVDWKINERTYLFGVLPNCMKLEYRLRKSLYAGLTFKSITNSYRYRNQQGYFKISDNHLTVFSDFYLPGNFAIALEAGHTLFREVKNRSSFVAENATSDGFLIKAGVYYRIRLNK
jgi:hypothetical protein